VRQIIHATANADSTLASLATIQGLERRHELKSRDMIDKASSKSAGSQLPKPILR
jgi:hypothetical protein